jgi:hypothetical protein
LVLQSGRADVSPGLWSEIRAAFAPVDSECVN